LPPPAATDLQGFRPIFREQYNRIRNKNPMVFPIPKGRKKIVISLANFSPNTIMDLSHLQPFYIFSRLPYKSKKLEA